LSVKCWELRVSNRPTSQTLACFPLRSLREIDSPVILSRQVRKVRKENLSSVPNFAPFAAFARDIFPVILSRQARQVRRESFLPFRTLRSLREIFACTLRLPGGTTLNFERRTSDLIHLTAFAMRCQPSGRMIGLGRVLKAETNTPLYTAALIPWCKRVGTGKRSGIVSTWEN